MKKTILVAVVFAAMILGMSSCANKDTKQCWKMEATYSLGGESISSARYCWKSQNEMDAEVKKYQDASNSIMKALSELVGESIGSFNISYTKASSYKTESDCNAQTQENIFDEIDYLMSGE